MKRQLIIKNICIICSLVLTLAIFSVRITDYSLSQQDNDYLKKMFFLFEQEIEVGNQKTYIKLIDLAKKLNFRVTVIDQNGVILAESIFLKDKMENHFHREEVQQLLLGSHESFSERKSISTGKKMLYYAQKVYSPDKKKFVILRISIFNDSLSKYISLILPRMIFLMLVMIVISVFFTAQANNSLLKSLQMVEQSLYQVNQGTYKDILPSYKDGDLNKTFNQINEIQLIINNNINKLDLEQKKFYSIINNLDNGVIILDISLKIQMVNLFIQDLFHVDKTVVGQNVIILNIQKELFELLEKVKTKEEKETLEIRREERYFNVVVQKVGNNLILLYNEITELKIYNNLKDEFLANASHELKTPLTSIVGFLELYQVSQNQQDKEKYISRIEFHSQRMIKLVSDMLEITRLDFIDSFENVKEINVWEIAQRVVERCHYLTTAKNVQIHLSGAGIIKGTDRSLDQILENLISNAIRYNQQNGQVFVNLEKIENGLVIEVEDTGIGLSHQEQNRIFEKFYCVEKSHSKKNGGTGLGLPIVRRLIELYAGKIEISSQVAKGTKITVFLSDC